MPRDYSSWAARWRVPLGFAMAVALAVLSKPNLPVLVAGAIVALPGLVLRGIAAGYVEKGKKLAACGPYRYSRNPLYVGSFIIGLGFAIAAASWILAVLFVIYFIAVYVPVIGREGEELRDRFGGEYERYVASVPAFLPRLFHAVAEPEPQAGDTFSWVRYRKNREYEAALGYVAGLLFLALKMKLR